MLVLAFCTTAVSVLALLHSVVALALVVVACPLVALALLALLLVTFALLFVGAWACPTTVSASAIAISSFASPLPLAVPRGGP
jgi:hypothetical protein